ncbi:TetR/AcrR family transcriptional regulator [Actinomycetes bacterium M1A6_2h]
MAIPTRPDRPYGGATAPERRAARRQRLTEAILDLVDKDGIGSLTVGVACERAAVSKRNFYENFDNMDDAAGRVLEDKLLEITTRIGAESIDAQTARGDDAMIERTVRAVLAAFDDPRLARLYLQAPGHDSLRTARDRAVTRFVDGFLTTLVADTPRARLTVHLLIAGSTEVVAMWLRGDIDLDRDDVVDTLVQVGMDALVRLRQ